MRAIFRIPKYDRTNNVYNDSSSLYKKLNVLKLNDLYRFNLGILCHNVIHSQTCPIRMKELFTLRADIIDRNTRANELDFYFTSTNLQNTAKRPSIAGAAFWNSLPDKLKGISSLPSFKTQLKALLISKY